MVLAGAAAGNDLAEAAEIGIFRAIPVSVSLCFFLSAPTKVPRTVCACHPVGFHDLPDRRTLGTHQHLYGCGLLAVLAGAGLGDIRFILRPVGLCGGHGGIWVTGAGTLCLSPTAS